MEKMLFSARNRVTLCILLLLLASQSNAQKKEKYYDYKWKECEPNAARFYSRIIKTDSGYYREDFFIKESILQMSGTFEDSLYKIKNGTFHYYHANGVIDSYGKYVHGKKEGVWLSFHRNRIMSDSTVFLNDKQIGTSLSWYPNGFICDSIYTSETGSGVKVIWFDNGVPSVAGKYADNQKKEGIWKYFRKNGTISCREIYRNSNLITKQYFDENGKIINDTTIKDCLAQFPGGVEAWIKYLSKHIYFPDQYKIINSDVAKVVVAFVVNEEGDIEDVYMKVPFHKAFDIIAEKTIKKSPKWKPAIQNNRNIKCYFEQVVNFNNGE
jgi:antitoxin component YwqK of YwqJK toxin-antitoxin module